MNHPSVLLGSASAAMAVVFAATTALGRQQATFVEARAACLDKCGYTVK